MLFLSYDNLDNDCVSLMLIISIYKQNSRSILGYKALHSLTKARFLIL